MAADTNSADELGALQKKRITLEKIVRIALAVEQLNDGLQSVILLGKPLSRASPKIKGLIAQLEEKIRLQPSIKIKETLVHLEKLIKGKLEIVLDIAEMDDEQLITLSANEEHVETLLRMYAKNAQTAVALKGILHARGEITRPTPFTVDTEVIVKKLVEISAREKTCRNRVTLSVMTMIDEAKALLSNTELAETMRSILEITITNLDLNLNHIQAGKSIESLPVPIEIVEIAGDNVTTLESGRTSQQHFTPLTTPPALQQKKSNPAHRASFFNKVMRWLSTPKGTTWKDIKEGRDLK